MFRILAHREDNFAVEALKELKGYSFEIVENGDYAKSNDVAVFTLKDEDLKKVRFSSRHARMAAHSLIEAGVVPAWASSTMYVVGLRRHPNKKTHNSIKETANYIGKCYAQWFAGMKCECPWGCKPTGESLEVFRKWQKNVFVSDNTSSRVQACFSKLEPLNIDCLQEAADRIDNGLSSAVTAFCLFGNKDVSKITDEVEPDLRRAVYNLTEELPFNELKVYTFDPDFLNLDLSNIVYAPLWDKENFEKHWKLSRDFADSIPKMNLFPLSDLFSDKSLVKEALKEGKIRAGRILKKMGRRNEDLPPLIRNLAPQKRAERLASEFVFYLLMTKFFSKEIYVGLEVYSSFLRLGKLYEWGEDYLPVAWAPTCLRQPWYKGSLTDERMAKIKKLDLL